jgi:hypothetical protein
MHKTSTCRFIEIPLEERCTASASSRLILCSLRCVLLAVLALPVTSAAQEQQRRADNIPADEADESSENRAVLFILDCSNSMGDEMPVLPRAGNVPQLAPKLDVAKRVLEGALEEIATRNQDGANILVGVRFYGHRVGWVPGSTPPRMLVQEQHAGQVPSGLRPSRDVETIQRVGRLGPPELAGIKAQLNRLVPWGETPLYLSLEQALADFDGVPRESDKTIVAILDGRNNQFEPTTTLEDVLRASEERPNVRIHILGLDIRDAEAEAARDEHTRLATAAGGTYSDVGSGSELATRMRELLSRGRD